MKNEIIKSFFEIEKCQYLFESFNKKNINIFLVGGYVRDSILQIQSKDIDLATTSLPEQTIDVLKENNIKFSDYAKKYGSVSAYLNNRKIEITTLREDINPYGRHTEVKFTDDLKKDASRRDFTINAIYLSFSGEVYDYYNGFEDLKNNTVRFIGDAEKRIKEDYIRIFRYYSFLGCFKKNQIISGYEDLLKKHIPKIREHLSDDIMRNEFLKFLNRPYIQNCIKDRNNSGFPNYLVKFVNSQWIDEDYRLGIEKCMKKIMKYL